MVLLFLWKVVDAGSGVVVASLSDSLSLVTSSLIHSIQSLQWLKRGMKHNFSQCLKIA